MRLFPIFAVLVALPGLIGCKEDAPAGLLTSPAGHSYAHLPLPDAKMVSVQVYWPMPWALDASNNPEVSNLATKMLLLGGTVDLSAQKVQDAMTGLGAEAYLFQSGVTLRGAVNAPPATLDQAVALTNSVLRTPALPTDLLNQLRGAAAQSQSDIYQGANEQAFLALRMLVMKDQPGYSESLSFSNADLIRAVTDADVEKWHRETVVAAGVLIAVAGPIDADAAGRAVDLLFAGLSDTAAPAALIKPMDLRPRSIVMHVPSATNTTLAVIATMPPTGDAGEMDDIIGSYILGGDENAILTLAMTAQLGTPTVFGAAIDAFSRQNRILVMSGQIPTEQVAIARETAIKTYAQMGSQPAQTAELTRWSAQLASNLSGVKNDPANRAGAMLEAMLDGNNPLLILDLEAMLAKVTPESVQHRFAAAYAPASDLIFVAISPDPNVLPGACVISQPQDVLACP